MKTKIYIHAQYSSYSKGFTYHAYSFHDKQAVLIEEREIEFEPPPAEVMQAGTVELYRAEQQRLRAEAHVKAENLQKQIDEMLCLENKAD